MKHNWQAGFKTLYTETPQRLQLSKGLTTSHCTECDGARGTLHLGGCGGDPWIIIHGHPRGSRALAYAHALGGPLSGRPSPSKS